MKSYEVLSLVFKKCNDDFFKDFFSCNKTSLKVWEKNFKLLPW